MRYGWLVCGSCTTVFLAGCTESRLPVDQATPPRYQIQDAAHNSGNAHFFFLPPLVPQPSFIGVFDASLSPVVQLCEWTGTQCVTPLLAEFTMTDGPGSETVRVVPADEQYIVNWHTDLFALDVAKTYRIRVLAGAQELGHADVDPVATGRELRNVNTGEYVPLLNGRTLPIKFRIEDGALAVAAVPNEATGISASLARHSCGLTTSGAAYCWGDNGAGQLGNGSTSGPETCFPFACSTAPVAVLGGLTFQSVTTELGSSCGLETSGAIYCWGAEDVANYGPVPVLVQNGLIFKALSLGGGHNCGLTTSGAIYCWGINNRGQLGNGTQSPFGVTTPILVSGGLTFQAVSAGGSHTCGLTMSGVAYCWGGSSSGELGNGSTSGPENCPGSSDPCSTSPVAVLGGLTFRSISAASGFTCGITTGGATYCWGRNAEGELGDGSTTSSSTPVAVSGGLSFQAISARAGHACGLTASGAAYCWGANNVFQLGNGSQANSTSPSPVLGGLAFAALSAGGDHTCGLTTAGAAYCWGLGDLGQLGVGGRLVSGTPVLVAGGLTFKRP